MPTYDYSCENGHRDEFWFPIDQRDTVMGCSECGAPLKRSVSVPRFRISRIGRGRCGGWPMRSTALGCDPRDIPSERKFLADKGITSVDFHADGDMKIPDAATRKKVLKAYKMHDRSGFGGVTG